VVILERILEKIQEIQMLYSNQWIFPSWSCLPSRNTRDTTNFEREAIPTKPNWFKPSQDISNPWQLLKLPFWKPSSISSSEGNERRRDNYK
jgi:hypothetical protein